MADPDNKADLSQKTNPAAASTPAQQVDKTKSTSEKPAPPPIPVSKVTVFVFEIYFVLLSVSGTYVLWRIWPYQGALETVLVFGFPLTFSADGDSRLLVIAVLSGLLGALIHATTSFSSYLGNRKLDGAWIPWFTLRPLIGMILGLLFYLIVRAGLVTSSGAQGVNPFGVAAIAGLAGLFSKQTVDKLREVFENAFPVKKGDQERTGSLTGEDKPTTTVPSTAGGAVKSSGAGAGEIPTVKETTSGSGTQP